MRKEIIESYINIFNTYVYKAGEVEFWFARDLQRLLGYTKWENFIKVIKKAQIACKNANQNTKDHFAESTRIAKMPKGGAKEIEDMMLSRYACYLVAQNGDSAKEPIAFAMNYFAVQTRKQEILEKRIEEWERVQARDKLSLSEKELSGIIYERGVDNKGFAVIRSLGDKALFTHSTSEMKEKLDVPQRRALADFLPTITIKAKDFANEITIFNVRKNSVLIGQQDIAFEHIKNNEDIRKLLLQRGIAPEELPAEEDLQKLKRRLKSQDKKLLKDIKKLK